MGFFDRLRKTRAEKDPGGRFVLQEFISSYGLKKAKPYEPSIEQDWWEGYYGTMRFAIQESGKDLHVYLGDVAEVTEIYLGRVHSGGKFPPESSPQRLDRIVGREGAEVAAQFVLLSHPDGDFDYPQLRMSALRNGIPRLSSSVHEIMIYEGYRGMSMIIDQTAKYAGIEADLKLALAMITALTTAAAQP